MERMNFSKAFALMKQGMKVKLPSWAGYWYWSKEKQTIIMHTKDGIDMDIRETQVQITHSGILPQTSGFLQMNRIVRNLAEKLCSRSQKQSSI